MIDAICSNREKLNLKEIIEKIITRNIPFVREKYMIVGGGKTEVGRYPYMASLQKDDTPICGGSLIHPEWVLTAGHCAGLSDKVIIGVHDLNNISLDDVEIIDIDYEARHPNYSSSTFTNDVMLVKLKAPSSFTTIHLDTGEVNLSAGVNVSVIGWGASEKYHDISNTLLEVEVDIISNNECDENYNNVDITKSMICAGRPGKDACQNDSGGPLFIKGHTYKEDIQVGIVSWGEGCAKLDYPGVYARVSYLHDFISTTIKNDAEPCSFPKDGFDYTTCPLEYACFVGDGVCDDIPFNTEECNFDGEDCHDCDFSFPNDGFDYSSCTQALLLDPCRIGNGICDISDGFYTEECNYDARDCDVWTKHCPFPDDGFDYSKCFVSSPCWIGDSRCDENFGDYNTYECNFDGGDCNKIVNVLITYLLNWIE